MNKFIVFMAVFGVLVASFLVVAGAGAAQPFASSPAGGLDAPASQGVTVTVVPAVTVAPAVTVVVPGGAGGATQPTAAAPSQLPATGTSGTLSVWLLLLLVLVVVLVVLAIVALTRRPL